MQIEASTLPNGITIVTSPLEHVRSVSVFAAFRLGSRAEPAELAGICHFIEHMLFKGTVAYPTARLLSEAIEGVGGDFNGSTSKESTEYSIRISHEHAARAFDILAEMILRPLFDPAEIEKERRVIIEELSMYRDTPQEWVQVLLDELVFPDHPLGREVIGTATTVGTMTREQLVAFFTTHYVPGALVITVAGSITHTAAREAIAQRFSDWEGPPAPRPVPFVAPAQPRRLSIQQRKNEQVNLCLAFTGLGYDDPDSDALAVLSAILGEGMSSRLFQVIREELGLVYDISTQATGYRETGIFEIAAGCDPRQVDAVITTTLREIRRLRDEPPTPAELQRIKDYVRGRLAIGMEDSGSIAAWLAGQMTSRGTIRTLETIMARIEAVTIADLQRVAGRIFQNTTLRFAAIGTLAKEAHFTPLITL